MIKLIFGGIAIVVLAVGAYFIFQMWSDEDAVENDQTENVSSEVTDENEPEAPVVDDTKTVLGSSVLGNDITAYHYGTGDTELLFIGGIHGGYSWNTALVAYELMDYLEENPESIPANVRVTVIPVMNPDGLDMVVGTTSRFSLADVPSSEAETVPGRFNANKVDLNRNFECDWQSTGIWQSQKVSGGNVVFSEPESQAIRNYVELKHPSAVVVWYSAAGGVFASNCHDGVLPETTEITKMYADASGYRKFSEFNFYEITGDMVNWLAREKIPAISVLLTTHKDVEWDKNRAGIEALLEFYAE